MLSVFHMLLAIYMLLILHMITVDIYILSAKKIVINYNLWPLTIRPSKKIGRFTFAHRVVLSFYSGLVRLRNICSFWSFFFLSCTRVLFRRLFDLVFEKVPSTVVKRICGTETDLWPPRRFKPRSSKIRSEILFKTNTHYVIKYNSSYSK